MTRQPLLVTALGATIAACSSVSATDRESSWASDPDVFAAGSGGLDESEPIGALVQKQSPAGGRPMRHEFSLSRQRVEFRTVDTESLDINDNVNDEIKVHDVEQTLTRFRYRYGPSERAFVVGLLGENIEQNDFDLDIELAGFEIGNEGFPHLGQGGQVCGAFDYSAMFSARAGDGEIPLIDPNTNAVVGSTDAKFVALEFSGRLGGGVDIQGLQLSAGLIASALAMRFDGDSRNDDFTADAFNTGVYARVWLRSNLIPLVGGIQVMAGDISGVSFGMGLHF